MKNAEILVQTTIYQMTIYCTNFITCMMKNRKDFIVKGYYFIAGFSV